MAQLGFVLGSYKFKSDETWLSYRSPFGKTFRVLKKDISGVSTDDTKPGKCLLRINGNGTQLADVELPKPWAYKAQEFILKEIGRI